jgi:hypothetical protein
MGRSLGTPTKSKVVTGASSYALAWTFYDPMHFCATIFTIAKSIVLTATPSYALARPFPDPVRLCATVCALYWLGSPVACVSRQALE